MYLCSILLHGWKTNNVKNIIGVLSLLLFILILPLTAKSQGVVNDPGKPTINIIEPSDINESSNFSIELAPKTKQKFKVTANIIAGGPEIDYIEFFAKGANGKRHRKKSRPWLGSLLVPYYSLTHEVEYEWNKVGGPFTVSVKAVATNGETATHEWSVLVVRPIEELTEEELEAFNNPPAEIVITRAQAKKTVWIENKPYPVVWEIDDEVRIGIGDRIKFVLAANSEDNIEFIEFKNSDPNPPRLDVLSNILNKDSCIVGCKKHSHSRSYTFNNSGEYKVTATIKTETDIVQVSWTVKVLTESEIEEPINPPVQNQPTSNQNQRPVSTGAIPAQTLTTNSSSSPLDVSSYFSDPDNDTLTYSASSSEASVATAQIIGSQMTIWTLSTTGNATITVTATDPNGLSSSLSFTVSVSEPALHKPPLAKGTIPSQSLRDDGGAITVDVAQYFSSKNKLVYEAASNPSGIVTTSVSGSIITITPAAAGVTTVVVTARDTVNTSLTAVQTISVVVRQTSAVIVRPPTNTDPTFNVPDRSNPRAEGLRKGVSVIVQLDDPDVLPLKVRNGPGLDYGILEVIGNITGIITAGPQQVDNHTWWRIEWDSVDLEGWSVEATEGEQILFRRPPDIEINNFNVKDDKVSPGQEFELEVKILNNGPGESAATEVNFYYHSGSKNNNLEDLSKETDLRIPGAGKLSVGSLQTRSSETSTLKVDAPSVPGTYYFGAFLPSNIHDTDNTDHLGGQAIRNNLAQEQQVKVISSPDYIFESVSVSNRILNPGQEFRLRVTVRNQGVGKPTSSPTLTYYRSSDALISSRDRKVGDEFVQKLDTGGTDNESIRLTAPTVPGVYYYGACVSKVTNERNSNNNCSPAAVITVRANVPANRAPEAVGSISAQTLTVVGSPIQIDVSANFSDPDNNNLTYNASSNTNRVATASAVGSQVTITPVGVGSAIITVTARDGTLRAEQTFSVTVTDSQEPSTDVSEGTWMPDANLRAAVRSELGLQEGDALTQQALQGLNKLSNVNEISNLTGLEYAKGIVRLEFSDNQISDITPLQNLTKLKILWLSDNQISDITPLQNLTKLTRLGLNNNQIGDITPLQNLTNLWSLSLDNNQISDITPLQNLTNLWSLSLENNQISDITPLQNLTKLTRLGLNNNQIGDITPLQNLTKLTGDLYLFNNQISDITPLQNLTKLTRLGLGNNQISDITPLQNLTKLTWLSLYNNQTSDITPLQNLTNLTQLQLQNNQISDITPLQNLTKLTELYLSGNQISDVTPLQNLTKLTELYLSGNQISDVTPLQNLTNLTELWLYDNQISDFGPLRSLVEKNPRVGIDIYIDVDGPAFTDQPETEWMPDANLRAAVRSTLLLQEGHTLTQRKMEQLRGGLRVTDEDIVNLTGLEYATRLTGLWLANNQISDITPLQNLTNLTTLELYNNQISDITPLQNLTNLTRLLLYNNQISDITPLQNLTKLTSELALGNNQISDITSLQNLTKLTRLQFRNNQIRDITALQNLTNLTTLELYNNQIRDVTPLQNLTKLKILSLSGNQIRDVTPLQNLTNLTTLVLANNQISNVTPLQNLTKLTQLLLRDNQITDYAPLRRLKQQNSNVRITTDIGIISAAPAAQVVPAKTALLANYPNPFNPETWIPYQLAKSADVSLIIYDVKGVVVRQLALGHRAAGIYYSRSRAGHWDGKNNLGEKVATGIYFVKFSAGDFTATRKMLIAK